jgi:hypothetical protein
MIDTDKYEEFENAMNEGRIERVHCLWVLAEVKRLREQYTELREALVGDSPNWTHEELIEKVLEIYDKEYDEK